jgi:hypothetical protein
MIGLFLNSPGLERFSPCMGHEVAVVSECVKEVR